jgi:hypothetical protein
LSDDRVRLRYTGDQATTFPHHGIGEVEPGGTFDVPASALPSFLRRADVEPEAPEASEAASDTQDGETKGGRRSGGRSRSGSPTGKNGTGEQ